MRFLGSLFARLRLLGLAWLFALGASGFAAEAQTVVVFGDSIAEGLTLPKEARDQAWVPRLQTRFAGKLLLINEGKGGRPTKSLPEFAVMLQRHPHFDLLLIALGTNDSRDISDECVPSAARNVREMIENARRSHGSSLRIFVLGPPNIRKDALGPTKPIAEQRDAKLRDLNAAFADLTRELHCEFLSLYGIVPEASLGKDGVHPDAAGHAAIADAVAAKLLP
jgi:acyl-CoA thioesterase-1